MWTFEEFREWQYNSKGLTEDRLHELYEVYKVNAAIYEKQYPPRKYVIVYDYRSMHNKVWLFKRDSRSVVGWAYNFFRNIANIPEDCHQTFNCEHFTLGDKENQCPHFEETTEFIPPGQIVLF